MPGMFVILRRCSRTDVCAAGVSLEPLVHDERMITRFWSCKVADEIMRKPSALAIVDV